MIDKGRIGALILMLGLTLTATAALRPPLSPSQPAQPRTALAPDALKDDLKVLWDILEEGHGALDRYTSVSALRREFDDAAGGLAAPMTVADFYVRILPLIAAIKDGHTRLELPPETEADLDAKPVHLPLELLFLGDRVYIRRDLSADGDIPMGAELLAIDGTPAGGIVDELAGLVPSDAGIRTARLRRLEDPVFFGRLLALRFGERRSFRIRFRPPREGPFREAVVTGLAATDVTRLHATRHPAAAAERRPAYEMSFRGSPAVLTVRTFADDPGEGRPGYPEFLETVFRSLAEKNARGLIIDLRGNGGGRDEYAKLLFAHVMDRPFLYYAAVRAKKDKYDLFRYTDETAESAAELARRLYKNALGSFDVLGHPNSGLQMPREPRFAGRVAILIDGGSRSATGEVISAFHYYKKAVFFGEEAGAGYYGSTGYIVTATLPHSRLIVRVPLVLSQMAVDGYPKDRGLVPDFPVAPTVEDILAGRDVVMERALTFLERK